MIILEYYYNEDNRTISIDFSINDDGDDFYRRLKLDIGEIKQYSPTIVDEYELNEIDNDFIIDLISEYLKENDLPEQLSL